MAFVSFAGASRHVDMSDGDLVRFATAEVTAPGIWSWSTPDGHDVAMVGQGFTYDADGRALSGRVSLVQLHLNDGDGVTAPDVEITGLNVLASPLDDSVFQFWDGILDGTDIINAQAISKEVAGTSGASYVFGDDIASAFSTDPQTVGDRGGNDIITIGTAAFTAVGDVRTVTGNVNQFFATYEGGNDQVLAPTTDQTQSISGDADVVGFFGTLFGGDDLVQTGSSSSQSKAVGDALQAAGINAAQRARVEGGDDEVNGISDSRATLIGDVEILGSFADVVGGDDTIEDTDAETGQVTRLVGDVFSDQSGGKSTIIGGNDIIHGNGGRESISGDLFLGNGGSNVVGGDDTIFGGAGDDSLFGEIATNAFAFFTGISGGDDHIFGGGGNDRLFGQTGDDTLEGGDGDDALDGGKGVDTLMGNAGFDVARYESATSGVIVRLDAGRGFTGEAAGDVLIGIEGLSGSPHADILIGDSSGNRLRGEQGDDDLRGQGGNDVLTGSAGNDTLNGGAGADVLLGFGGEDTATYAAAPSGVIARLDAGLGFTGEAAGDSFDLVENLIGSAHDDVLIGDIRANALDGGAGSDDLRGQGGSDTLTGGAGADKLDGGSDSDTVSYAASPSGVIARLDAGQGFAGDALGDELISIENLVGSSQGDTLIGDANDNGLFGGAGVDDLRGQNGDDTLGGGEDADRMDGGSGNDFASYRDAAEGVIVRLDTGTGFSGEALGDELASIEGLIGSAHQDILIGDRGANQIAGEGGADDLRGGAGADSLFGGIGEDVLRGGAGADLLSGGEGQERDTASYQAASTGVIVRIDAGQGFAGEAAGDILTSIENLKGSAHSDTLIGAAGENVLDGGAGDDDLRGQAGEDRLEGGDGRDKIDGGEGFDLATYESAADGVIARLDAGRGFTGDAAGDVLLALEGLVGSEHDDILIGDSAGNEIFGGGGSDDLRGQSGDDELRGGGGDDLLSGGLGDDTFIFEAASGHDRITDFEGGADDDVIVLFFAPVQIAASQVGADTLIDFGDGNTLTLQNFTASALAEDDILVAL